ncbi:MAG: MerR family transcriptional regulator [Fibrobacteres bacterium]|nr:MerR family transcriptional regulator [Fibrobacterota bacterium]
MVGSKIYYSISEVCREVGLEQHVLRYWETEFPSLRPKKNRAGNRAYRKKEIDLVKYIKFLLYDKKYTIQGAKKVVNDNKNVDVEALEQEQAETIISIKKSQINEIRNDLRALLELIKK